MDSTKTLSTLLLLVLLVSTEVSLPPVQVEERREIVERIQ
jgi:hypothetical protein